MPVHITLPLPRQGYIGECKSTARGEKGAKRKENKTKHFCCLIVKTKNAFVKVKAFHKHNLMCEKHEIVPS